MKSDIVEFYHSSCLFSRKDFDGSIVSVSCFIGGKAFPLSHGFEDFGLIANKQPIFNDVVSCLTTTSCVLFSLYLYAYYSLN
jgi:hypothetical protein